MAPSAFVGRGVELSRLDDLIRAARLGRGAVALVTGEAGIGKSALVREAIRCAPGNTMVLGRAVSGSLVAGRALCDAAVAAVAAGADPVHPSLRLLARPLARLLGFDLPWTTNEAAADQMAFDPHPLGLADGLLRLVALTPGRPVLVLEDLHWADPETLEALHALSDRAVPRGVLVIMTARAAESSRVDEVVDRLALEPTTHTVTLGPLDTSSARQLTADLIGPSGGPELVNLLVERADGVPLAIEQLCKASLHRLAGLPPTIAASVETRLRQLSPEHRRLIDAAALTGQRTAPDLLATALGLSSDDVAAAVAAGVRIGLLQPLGADGVTFSHDLLRDAVKASTTGPERRGLAEAMINAADPDNHEMLAQLAVAAGRNELAAQHFLAVANQALAAGALSAADPAARQALSLMQDPAQRLRAQQVLLGVHARRGDVDAALAVADEITDQFDPDDNEAVATMRVALARVLAAAERWAEARAQVDLAQDQLTSTPVLLALAAQIELGAGRVDAAERLARDALAGAGAQTSEGVGDAAARCEAYEILGRIARTRDVDEALTWFRRASSTAYAHGMPLWRARALHELATISQLRDLTVDDLLRAREAAVDAGAPGLVASVDFHLAAIHGVRFEVPEAMAAGQRVLDGARRLALPRQQAWGWILIGQARAATADRDRAADCGRRAIALAPDDAEIAALASGTCLGLSSLLAGDRRAAVTQFAEAVVLLRPLPRTPMPPWYLWPLIALAWTDDGVAALTETDSPGIRASTGVDGLWHLADAVRAGRAGQPVDTQLAAARAAFDRVPGFDGYAHIGWRLAAEAALADGWGEPLPWLEAAATWADTHDLTAFAGQCRSLARRAGGPQRRRGRGSTPVPPALAARHVTTREADILALLALGRSNQQIAEQLYLSPRTVKTHVESLLRKTGAANRTELATLATTTGLHRPS